jgi:hypothetical protein
MTTIDKYLKESKEKEAIKSLSPSYGAELKAAYYGVADHIEKLAIQLNNLTGETGLFGKDLGLAVKARDAFNKITLGKYI